MRGQRHHQHKARSAQGSGTATGEYFRASQAAIVSQHAMDMSHLGILWNDKVKQGPDACSEITHCPGGPNLWPHCQEYKKVAKKQQFYCLNMHLLKKPQINSDFSTRKWSNPGIPYGKWQHQTQWASSPVGMSKSQASSYIIALSKLWLRAETPFESSMRGRTSSL